MSKRKIGIAAVVLVLLIASAVWAFWPRGDAQVEKLKRMQDDMFAGGPPNPDQFNRMRKEMENLSSDQRRQVMDHGRERFQREMAKRADEYFAAPPEKRKEVLDRHIREMEKLRKEMEKRRAENGGSSGTPGGQPPAGGPGQGGPGANGQGGAGGPGANGQSGPGGARDRNASPVAQSERRNQMLDNTSPGQRAGMSAYFSALPAAPHGTRAARLSRTLGRQAGWTLTIFDEDKP